MAWQSLVWGRTTLRVHLARVETLEDLREQNRILRERLAGALASRGDSLAQAIYQHIPPYVTVINPEGRFLATGRTSETFGSVIGRSVFEFIDSAQHTVTREAYARVCATRQPVVYESNALGENGEPNHTYLVRAVPVIENDVVTSIVLIPNDITDRVRLERSLAQSKQKLRFAVAATGIGLWSWDVAGNEVIWDARMLGIFGVPVAPTTYEGYLALIHPDDRPIVQRIVDQTVRTGVYESFEHRVAAKEGEAPRWVLATGTVIADKDGNPTGLMGGALDITVRKNASAQLERAQRVEVLGQLTAGLAHNFNNLLGVMIPNLEFALDGAGGDDSSLPAVMEAALQARDLIKRLMSVTRPRPATTFASSDPREAVERALTLCRATFPREIQFRHAPPEDAGRAGGDIRAGIDGSDLDQVLFNLFFNARDALERSSGRVRFIEVALDRVEIHGVRKIRLRVCDNGVGMSPLVQSRIFEPFFTTKPANRGGGLGLADALVRVRTAGGSIDCQSVEGEGTTFTVLLPETSSDGEVARPVPLANEAAQPGTILIVDDEAPVRVAIGRVLRRRGHTVLDAASAEDARAILLAHGADVKLVLLDNSMPLESGPEALASLKRLCAAPIVMFTGGAAEVPAGAAGLLEKPARGVDLVRVVEDALSAARARSA